MTNILSDVSFYKDKIDFKLQKCVDLYINLMDEYFISIIEKKKINNSKCFLFIFERGMTTIQHVFILLLLYTKNLQLVLNECKKGYFYYIEFIEQIMDEDYNFLHLSSSEAVLFVYKKTIYEINLNYRKKNNRLLMDEELFMNNFKLIITKFQYNLYSLMKQVIHDHDNIAIIKEKLINNKISIMHSNADYFDDK